jgi:hypothetical protein
MPELVSDYGLHFVDVVGSEDQPRVHVNVLATCDEGVDAVVIDQDDLDALVVQVGRFDQRFGNIAE